MTDEDRGPEVVLMCGLAGSGKTTYSKELETRGYVRLSVDEEVWERFGRFGVDYDASLYEAHSAVARRSLDERLTSLVTQGAVTSSSTRACGSACDARSASDSSSVPAVDGDWSASRRTKP